MVINMLNKVSVQLSKFLLQKIKEDKQEQDVYTYGFELIISTIIFFVSIIVISAILSSPISGLVFLITFVPLRLFTGGYHADTYSRCFILSNLTYLLILIIKNLLWACIITRYWYCLLLISYIFIMLKAPVINPAQPINPYKKIRSKKITKIILCFETLWIFLLSYSRKELFCMAVLSICLIAFFMFIADEPIFIKFKRKGKNEHDFTCKDH
ncbi:MAG: accessory gene regulator B family protein [Lachnospiraceae bacterium]